MQISIDLPDQLASRIRQRVASGEFASESDVVREALEEMEDKDRSHAEKLERWLRIEAVAAHDDYMRDPSKVTTAHDVRAAFQARREAEDAGD